MNQPFPPGDRTYYVSDERLRAFKALTPEEKLRWVEEVSTFLRLAKAGSASGQDEKSRLSTLMDADRGTTTLNT